MRRRRKFLKSMMLVVILPSKTSLFMRRRRKFLHNHGTQTPSKLPKHPPKYRKHPPKYPKHPQNTPKPPNLRSEILLTRGGVFDISANPLVMAPPLQILSLYQGGAETYGWGTDVIWVQETLKKDRFPLQNTPNPDNFRLRRFYDVITPHERISGSH